MMKLARADSMMNSKPSDLFAYNFLSTFIILYCLCLRRGDEKMIRLDGAEAHAAKRLIN